MYLKLSLFLSVIFLFLACTGEPEPDEFTQIRSDMQKRQELVFGSSIEKLETRKRNYQTNRKHSADEIDPVKELQAKKEAERKRWLSVDIDEEEAQDWKALGLSPKSAARWKKTGLSYNTISVLIKEDISPSEAVVFMNKNFDKYPKAFLEFAKPLFEFKHSCQSVLSSNSNNISLIRKKCHEYIRLLEFSTISGHLADEYLDNDLSLEYISKLRRIDSEKAYIQKEMKKESQLSMINGNSEKFALLFPILESSPSKEEMFFVKEHNLKVQNTTRYKSNKYYEFWINKEKSEEKARVAAIKKQQALKRAKTARLKAEANRMKALAFNKMVASECGEMVTSVPSTGEKVHVEGRVLYLIGKIGSNIFAYVVKNSKDGKSYLIRDPHATKAHSVGTEVSLTAVTVGRVVSVSLDDDGTATYKHYAIEGKELYPMLKFVSNCAYHTKSIDNR